MATKCTRDSCLPLAKAYLRDFLAVNTGKIKKNRFKIRQLRPTNTNKMLFSDNDRIALETIFTKLKTKKGEIHSIHGERIIIKQPVWSTAKHGPLSMTFICCGPEKLGFNLFLYKLSVH